MSWVATGVTAASIGMSYMAGQKGKAAANKEAALQREAGEQRKAAANFEANVLESNATQRVAIGQQEMFDAQKTTELVQSRALALAAASGGGASSPTVLTVMGNIAKEGAVNASRAMYSGEESARAMRLQAFEKRAEGQYAEIGGNLQGDAAEARGRAAQYQSYGSIANSIGGMYGKYGTPSQSGQTGYFQFTGYDRSGGPSYG